MPWTLNHYRKYPFTAQPADFPHLFVEEPIRAVLRNPELAEKLSATLETIIKENRVPVDQCKDHEESILIFYALLEFSKYVGDKRLINKIALSYAKTAGTLFEEEDEDILVTLGIKTGLRVYEQVLQFTPTLPRIVKQGKRELLEFLTLKYAVPIEDYVRVVSKRLAHDPNYTLSNTIVVKGLVFVDKQVYQRILEEHVFHYIAQLVDTIPRKTLSDIENTLNQLKERVVIQLYYERSEEVKPAIKPESEARPVEGATEEPGITEAHYPPCIKRIIDILNTGGNPSHHERFTLAAFLGQIGLGVDEILEYFKKSADYNERIARYQVEHILGLRGSRKKYMPYSCDNLKAMNICPIAEQCLGGKNPVAVYRYVIRQERRRKRKPVPGSLKPESGERAAGGI